MRNGNITKIEKDILAITHYDNAERMGKFVQLKSRETEAYHRWRYAITHILPITEERAIELMESGAIELMESGPFRTL